MSNRMFQMMDTLYRCPTGQFVEFKGDYTLVYNEFGAYVGQIQPNMLAGLYEDFDGYPEPDYFFFHKDIEYNIPDLTDEKMLSAIWY